MKKEIEEILQRASALQVRNTRYYREKAKDPLNDRELIQANTLRNGERVVKATSNLILKKVEQHETAIKERSWNNIVEMLDNMYGLLMQSTRDKLQKACMK